MRIRGVPVLLLVGVTLCGCGGSGTQVSPEAAPPPAATPSLGGSPQPQQASSAAPSTTSTSAVGLVVNGDGTDLTKPQSPTVKTLSHGTSNADCYGLGYDPGFSGGCSRLSSRLGDALLQVEARGTEERTLLWTITGQRANLALRRVRTLGAAAGSVNAQDSGAEATITASSDVNNDGTTAFIVETPAAAGEKPPLATLDIVQTSGLVGLHRDLHGGYAQKAQGGGLETWTALDRTALDKGRFEHSVFQFQSGAWRVVEDGTVERRQIPATTGTF